MRKILLVPILSLIAAPALAHDRNAPPPDTRDAARALGDQRVQNSIIALADALTDAVLATRVDPIGAAVPDSNIRPGDTLGSVESRNDPAFRSDLRRNTAQAVKTVGRTAGAAAAMSDEIDRTTDRINRILDGAKR